MSAPSQSHKTLCEIIKNQRAKNTKEMSTEEKSVWNKICCIFGMLNFLNMGAVKDYIEYNGADTGVRTTFSGKLYVDKKVFFKRTEVRNVINAVINSKELKAHIKISKNKKK